MSERPPPRDRGGILLVVAFAGTWLVVLVGLTVVGAVLSVAAGSVPTPDRAPPTALLATVMALQLPGMILAAVAAHGLVDRLLYEPAGVVSRPAGWTSVWAPHDAPVGFVLAGVVLGLIVGWFPGLVAEAAAGALPEAYSSSLDLINDALLHGAPGWRMLFVAEITIGAPLVEELIFRGFMWEAFRRGGGPWVAWIGTSVMFAAYHLDPVQSPAVLLTGAAIGWLRWSSGSIWPCVAAHAVNNGLGVVVALVAPEMATPLPLALGSAALTVALLGGTAWWRRQASGALVDTPWPEP